MNYLFKSLPPLQPMGTDDYYQNLESEYSSDLETAKTSLQKLVSYWGANRKSLLQDVMDWIEEAPDPK